MIGLKLDQTRLYEVIRFLTECVKGIYCCLGSLNERLSKLENEAHGTANTCDMCKRLILEQQTIR